MNRLLIPTLTFAMLLMAGCGDADKPGGTPTAPSDESATPAPAPSSPSGDREPSTPPPAQPTPPGTEPSQ
jgi:hypothetical protein